MNEQELKKPSFALVSDHACLLTFSDVIDEFTADYISRVNQALKTIDGIVDLVPSYTTLLVVFDMDHYDRFAIEKQIKEVIASISSSDFGQRDTCEVVIPVYYGAEVGPDIDDVAKHCGIQVDDVIRLHSSTRYRAYAVGFAPGYAFLGNTPDTLHIPRKETPRLKVIAGSVAIAERQTAVYPSTSPGGWQIIGRTPIQLVDWGSENLAIIEVGDTVKFEPISRDEFLAQGGSLDGF
ncbi:5-oxoprolinase subunit PxpB [Marinomonas mediterranea]|uniref:Carboxyltransferase domain-containing protein n=1 Tax=Marinomonas mediterranea (strain ATCC 700492 / JCM 21426 / NBRC 103028 / MMB-1) TaxID=717774 RepID=F2JVE2_MARM1|nr:5-oxoprolinase subunit PxpB [Marinomonas mediterranea]ADZ89400.1 Conserved hypothetical protein CHP00370 [Marinomonas mediterranea MMB-1]WCN07496.1 5-oxoprolinase subunit PxpB [Marinomonas mediterranea]WCN11594.1 5-oxoprolinase subunit PxpB [Marinomonas mediterranea]WCN15658.1 5-oxoprolinase subunit PxpB [Marinomonas mediterranea MMB-1]